MCIVSFLGLGDPCFDPQLDANDLKNGSNGFPSVAVRIAGLA